MAGRLSTMLTIADSSPRPAAFQPSSQPSTTLYISSLTSRRSPYRSASSSTNTSMAHLPYLHYLLQQAHRLSPRSARS
jgi:hypothetical protein